ncbi:MAG TPA: TolC family protein [Flavobacterium sp.]|nr:TolC family protein [Flavobacterium sp.]
MKKINFVSIAVFLIFSISIQAQVKIVTETKVWTLEECVNYALANNITIKQTELDSIDASIEKRGAIGSFLPTLNGNLSHSWNIGLNQDITTGLLKNQTTQFTAAGIGVGFDIYKGMQNQNRLRRANLSIVASKYQLVKMQEDVALNVANAFLNVLFNKELLKIQQEQKRVNEQLLAQTQEYVNAGSLPKGDLLDVKASIATDTQQIILAENALLISKLSLAQLLQLKEFYNFDVSDEVNITDDNSVLLQTPLEIYNKAKEERIELKIAKNNLEIAMKDLTIAKGAFQPTLQGFYNFNTRASYSDIVTGFTPDTENPTSPIGFVEGTNQLVLQPNFNPVLGSYESISEQFDTNKGQSFGVQLGIPVFNGFSVRNNVERTKVDIERRKIALEQEDLNLQRNVFTAYTDAKGALNAYESALVTVDARQGAYEYASEKYKVGLINSFDFYQAQSLLTRAQSEVLRTKYDYIFKLKILEFYFGIPINQIMQK